MVFFEKRSRQANKGYAKRDFMAPCVMSKEKMREPQEDLQGANPSEITLRLYKRG